MDKHVTQHTTEEQLDWVEDLHPTHIELKPDQRPVRPLLPSLEIGRTRTGKTRAHTISIIDEGFKLHVISKEGK